VIGAHFLRAVAELLHLLINLFIIIIIIRSVMSWMGNIPPNTFTITLRRMTDPIFRWVHRTFPFMIVGSIDISPIVICVALYFIDSLLYGILMDAAINMGLGSR
jgi:YggT family protein